MAAVSRHRLIRLALFAPDEVAISRQRLQMTAIVSLCVKKVGSPSLLVKRAFQRRAAVRVGRPSGCSDGNEGFARRREPICPHEGLECLGDLGPGGGPVILVQLIQDLHE